ncbi:retrovirus-related Pol polyprotein from transposon TNT 1-94, partial [Trifolium medium]|nr:retrovirus-related Pol polyprotein from transposon TNT 1-94 [Trifolium medium]
FDGHYDHWAMLMENLLRSKEYWPLIEVGVTIAPASANAEQQQAAAASKLRDLKVKNYLFQSLIEQFLKRFLNVKLRKIFGMRCVGNIKDPRR